MSDSRQQGLRGAGDRIKALGETEHVQGAAKVLQGFKDFISRGNAIELAVGVVIGAAFSGVVGALQTGFISPLIGWIFGQPNLENVWNIGPFSWRDGVDIDPIRVGVILSALLNFLITAAAIYFLIVLPLNALAARRKKGQAAEPKAPAEDILLLQEIRDLLAQRVTPAVANDAPGASPAPPAPGRAPGDGPPSIPPGTPTA